MNDLRTFGWYAARIAPHLPKEAFSPVPSRLWGGFLYLLVAALGIIAIGILTLPWWANILISLAIGVCFSGMSCLGHEILHGTVVRKRWLRDWLGAIAFMPLNVGPYLWSKWHNQTHHIHTQVEEKDPDHWPTYEQLLDRPVFRQMYRLPLIVRSVVHFCSLLILFTIFSTKMFFSFVGEFKKKKQPFVYMQFMIPWAIWIGLLVWMGPVKWLFAYLVPLLITNFILMCYISTQHNLNPLGDVNDPLVNTLSVTVPKWVDILHFNFSYHTEHHIFPGISSKYYPLVKEQVKKMWPEIYHELPFGKALLVIFKTPRVYNGKTELFDPHQEKTYGLLGHGLDPENIRPKE
ncbi:MAG TPA: acyl-CoA desaturase [Candidatus Bathyarchaeia archaeon]|nr:acyl-CoA desaturase [Candidatus Bathyarchaeia archaeon]